MSFIKKLSFRKKTSIECTVKPIETSEQNNLHKHNGDTKAVLLSVQEPTSMSENDESVSTEQLGTPMLEVENKGELRSNPTVRYSLCNDNESVELLEPLSSPPVDNTGSDLEDSDTSNSLSNKTPS